MQAGGHLQDSWLYLAAMLGNRCFDAGTFGSAICMHPLLLQQGPSARVWLVPCADICSTVACAAVNVLGCFADARQRAASLWGAARAIATGHAAWLWPPNIKRVHGMHHPLRFDFTHTTV